MHHLHDLQQVILLQMRQRLRQLLHIHIPALLLRRRLARRTRAVRVADGTGLAEDALKLGLRVAEGLSPPAASAHAISPPRIDALIHTTLCVASYRVF